ncbi:MAG: hypothetical protein JWN25_3343 [Verrucomicrobiales bacterium]|jgi:hypothetical protein|nr:hypothetical protein [Verrucomicrobiales bacterium]
MKYPSPADIAEMKARGYDSTTIAVAEQQSTRWAAAQEVSRLIETAFAGVTLGNGVGLQEAQGLDDHEAAETCAAYRAKDEKDDWHQIPAEGLKRCNSSLSFFDAEGMKFHLPAYLLADLRDDYGFGMAFCLTQTGDYERYFRLLSPAQRSSVRAFLLHILDEPDYAFERPHIVHALNGYWSDELSTKIDRDA